MKKLPSRFLAKSSLAKKYERSLKNMRRSSNQIQYFQVIGNIQVSMVILTAFRNIKFLPVTDSGLVFGMP